MKFERWIGKTCDIINGEAQVKIRVHLAERWCGYDIARVSECLMQKECGLSHCELINSEEEKAIDQLISDYYKQLDIRDKIRESMKDSNV